MYEVTIINDNEKKVMNAVSSDIEAPKISGSINQGINTIDTFIFSIFLNNPCFHYLYSFKTLVEVFNIQTEEYEFRGRVLAPTSKMESSGKCYKSFVCESELGYLNDSTQEYAKYENIDTETIFRILLEKHNEDIEDYKKIKLGNINNKKIDTIEIEYEKTFKNIQKLIEKLGGEIKLRHEEDGLYIDYVDEIGEKISDTEIRLGHNIKSISENYNTNEIYTRFEILGAKLKDSEKRLSIESVNNNKRYIDDEEAIKKFGVIKNIVIFDDIEDKNELLKKGIEYVKLQKIELTNTIDANDLSLIGLDYNSFKVGNYYPIKHELLGIDYIQRIIEKTINIESPSTNTIGLGKKSLDIKDYNINKNKKALEAEKNVQVIKQKVDDLETKVNKSINKVEKIESDINGFISIDAFNNAIEDINKNFEIIENSINSLDARIKNLEGGV